MDDSLFQRDHIPKYETAFGGIDKKTMKAKTLGVMDMLSLKKSPGEKAGDLTIAHQQMIEIVKVLGKAFVWNQSNTAHVNF